MLEPESLNRMSSERLQPGTGDAVTMRTGSKFARSKVLAPRIAESNVLQQGD